MTRLDMLPIELLLSVWSRLDDLEGAACLAWTSRRTHKVWSERQGSVCFSIVQRKMIAFEAACELVQNQEHQEEAAGGTLHLDYELTYHGTPSALSKRNARLFANEKYAHAVYGAFLMEWRGDLGKQPFRDPPFLLPAEKMRFYSAFYRTLKYIVSNIGRRANKQPPYTLETPVRPAVTLPQLRGMAEICELLVLPCICKKSKYTPKDDSDDPQ